MLLYLKTSEQSLKRPLVIINKFTEVTEYNINTQYSVVFLYTSNKHIESKWNNSIYKTIKKSKNLTKELEDLYNEN